MKRIYIPGLVIMLALSGISRATTYTITFQNYSYTPKTLTNVNVGDTIVWQGADASQTFGLHPLASLQIPQGAAAFGVPAGNLPSGSGPYQYIVKVAGTYNYQCNNHFAFGMVGSFTASAAGVEQPVEMKMMTMSSIYPNPAMNEAMVDFSLNKPSHVTLRVYNAIGDLVQTPTNEDMAAGDHMLMLDTKNFASGTYQYVLQAGDAVLQRNEIVVK